MNLAWHLGDSFCLDRAQAGNGGASSKSSLARGSALTFGHREADLQGPDLLAYRSSGTSEKGEKLNRLPGKVAVITGAASGIGLAATQLSQEGAKVLAIDVEAGALDDAVSAAGSSVVPFTADVTKEAQIEQAMARAEEVFGGIDVLLANAGILGTQSSFETSSIDNFNRVLVVNVTGVLCYEARCSLPSPAWRG